MANFHQDGEVRVLEGAEPLDAPLGEGAVEASLMAAKFKRFVKEFGYVTPGATGINVSTFKYREQLMQNCDRGDYYLKINLCDLNSHYDGEVLAHELQKKPTEMIPLAERVLKELYTELVMESGGDKATAPYIQLILSSDVDLEGTFGTLKPCMVRDLTSAEVETLVVVQGICISVKRARHKARKVTLRCRTCERTKEVEVPDGYCAAHIPTMCDNTSTGIEKCRPGSFQIVDELCHYIDDQTMKLQELPEHVPVGEMPRSYDLHVHNCLVDKCVPGTRLTALGTFCATERSVGANMSSGRGRGLETVKYSYIKVLGLEVAQGGKTVIEVTPEEEEQFRALAKDPTVRQQIYDSIAPSICAGEKDIIGDVKKALAVLLFGGSRKNLPDGARMRGDINMLLLGDPGTAKSQFLKFAEKASPISVYTSGKGSSAAGLTAAIVRDRDGFALEGGAMVLADGGIVCIDEFDKMDVKDRVAIHEAMEQQTISIAKAGITTMLNTRCSVLAAANPRFGTYDDLATTAEQSDFEDTILSRFDMVFIVKDVRDSERDINLAMHMIGLHSGEVTQLKEGPLPVLFMRKYLAYCRSRCEPRVTASAGDTLKNKYVSIRQAVKGERGIPITVRQLEAIIRMSEALAKMELSDDVTNEHVEEALRLFNVSTLDAANKDRGELGLDGWSDEMKDQHQQAEDQVRRLVPRGGRKNKFGLAQALVQTGIPEKVASRAIQMMIRKGDLQERANFTVHREH